LAFVTHHAKVRRSRKNGKTQTEIDWKKKNADWGMQIGEG